MVATVSKASPNAATVREFWDAVNDALRRIDCSAEVTADSLRGKIERLPNAEQRFFFHSDPFDVALELAGISGDRAEQLRENEALRREEEPV